MKIPVRYISSHSLKFWTAKGLFFFDDSAHPSFLIWLVLITDWWLITITLCI
jgi:hypothetical protein